MRRRLAFFTLFATAMAAQEAANPPLVLILIGPPAAGKSTQAKLLVNAYRMPVISDEDLRKDAVKSKQPLEQAMNEALRARLQKLDVTKGFILDGFPETRAEADYVGQLVRELKLPSPLVVQLDVKDEVARARAQKQGLNMKEFEARLKEYHRELDLAREYYPQSDIWMINAEKSPEDVLGTIKSLVQERIK